MTKDPNNYGPQSSRRILEDGTVVNQNEGITGFPGYINSDHANIHFKAGYVFSAKIATIAASATKSYRIEGPTDLFMHLKNLKVSGFGASLHVKLVKGATTDAAGTAMTNGQTGFHNLNHNGDDTPQSTIYENSTRTASGYVWDQDITYGDTTGNRGDGSNFVQTDYLEYVTKSSDEEYFLEITNLDGANAATNVLVKFFMYEEAAGESDFPSVLAD